MKRAHDRKLMRYMCAKK